MADRNTTITLKINDQFSGPAKQFADGMDSMVEATGRASQAIEEHESKQTTLHEVLGGSRRETALLEQTFLSLTGTTGALATGIEALATGIGPLGLLIAGVGVVGSIAKEKMDEYAAAVEKARVEEVRMSEARSSQAAATKKLYEDASASAQEAIKKTSAELVNLKEQADAIYKNTEAGNSTEQSGQQFEMLTLKIIETQRQLDSLRDAAHVFGGTMQAMGGDVDSASHHLETTADLVRLLVTDFNNAKVAAADFATTYNAGIAANASGAEDLIAQSKVFVKSWSDVSAEGSKFSAEQSKANAKAQSEAETLAKVYAEIGDASKFASAEVNANMNAIAHSALTASEKMSVLRQYISTLPQHMRTQIEIAIQTHADALLMKILGGGNSGAGKGNQQGDEYNFTLEGENYGVRAAYMNMYHDYGTANAAWEKDHRAELAGQGVTGAGQANTQTGEVYQYAMGVHETVTAPRTMTVGERGPERVDVTPGGAGGMGGNIITINWSSMGAPSAFEVQQMARRLKQAMANDGA